MSRQKITRGLALAALSVTVVVAAAKVSGVRRESDGDDAQRRTAPVQSFTVVRTLPHDPNAFTQGLVYADGEFYESTGLHGESSLRRVEIATGKVLQRKTIDPQYFAEGLALVGDALVQLTWQHKIGFVYDRKSFSQRRTFPYQTEGWGIAYDAKSGLVMSDGTDQLFFLDPETYAITRTVRVTDAGRSVGQLNELEWIEGEVWANVWMTDRIARITPATGVISAWVDLTTLWPLTRRTPSADVLNGIAYDPGGKRIFVTGKKWPQVYEIRVLSPGP